MRGAHVSGGVAAGQPQGHDQPQERDFPAANESTCFQEHPAAVTWCSPAQPPSLARAPFRSLTHKEPLLPRTNGSFATQLPKVISKGAQSLMQASVNMPTLGQHRHLR